MCKSKAGLFRHGLLNGLEASSHKIVVATNITDVVVVVCKLLIRQWIETLAAEQRPIMLNIFICKFVNFFLDPCSL